MIEVHKSVQNINPSFMKEIVVQKDITHNLRCNVLEAEIYSINERHDPKSTMLSIASVILPRLTA